LPPISACLKKILLVRFSSIGDIVLTTPVIRCLKLQLPEVEIHYLTKESFSGILVENPYLEKVWTYKQSLDEVLPLLKAENFDFIADFELFLANRTQHFTN
jgi:ADP-heptose:LPS heptosyltransferase